jgi:hypothetical protein
MNDRKERFEQAIDNILEAQELLQEAIALLEKAVDLTDDQNADAYLVDHLKIMASDGHGFLSRDLNCDTWIERLEEEMYEAANEEDEDEEELEAELEN